MCKAIEEKIFLYQELTAVEKEKVDRHIRGCESCERMFSNLTYQREKLLEVSIQNRNETTDPLLTTKIMNAISVKHHEISFIFQLKTVFFSSFRYGMAAVSLGLLLILFSESITSSENAASTRIEQINYNSMPVLDSKKFVTAFRTRNTISDIRSVLLSECRRICYHGDNSTACDGCGVLQKVIN